jgi:transcription termination factor Rho
MTESAHPQLFDSEALPPENPAKKTARKRAKKAASEPTPTESLPKEPSPLKKTRAPRSKKPALPPQQEPVLAPGNPEKPIETADAAVPAQETTTPKSPAKKTRAKTARTTARKASKSNPHPELAPAPSSGLSIPAAQNPANQDTTAAGHGTGEQPATQAPATQAQPPASPRQYPVYVPLHVAKQMEQEGRPAPLSVTASQAVELHLPVTETPAARTMESEDRVAQDRPETLPPPPRHDRPERSDRPVHERSERHERHDRHGKHGRRGGRDDRRNRREDHRADLSQDQPQYDPPQTAPLDPPKPEDLGLGEGMIEISGKGFGFLRDPKRNFSQHPNDIFVPPEIVRCHGLRDGQWIKCQTRRNPRGFQLHALLEVNGDSPEKAKHLPAFDELTVISPIERIRMETVPDRYTTRILDLMAPVGKGQRGLIVAPPRTGKTTLLQHIADAVGKNHPDIKLIILLVDERPEEVTDFKRNVPGAEIMASSNDMDVKSHTRIAQLAVERAKRLVEAGKDVFILLDSITRVARAFNNSTSGGRTMSGGIDSRAMEIPRRIFAAARNTEEAGSLTIIATALIDTNSRMDEVIFQEFKGTGNMELVLDRKIAEHRTYPAVDIFLSGTRREELLVAADDLHKIHVIRRGLSGHKPEEALERLLFFARKFPTNAQMLREIPA